MSRIGKKPVELPKGVSASVSGQTIEVKGPKGARNFTAGDDVTITIDGTTVNVGSGTVQVQASNTSDVMSVAASGAASTGNVGFAGTVTVNETADVTEARIGTSTVTGGTVRVQAGEGSGASSARIRAATPSPANAIAGWAAARCSATRPYAFSSSAT